MPTTNVPRHEEEHEEDDPRYDDADISTAPFTSHSAYSRGLWKEPIAFVPAAPEAQPAPSNTTDGQSIAQKYLAIMFPNGQPTPAPDSYPLCGICGDPVKEADHRVHFLSAAHQSALPRAPIPSAIDRTRMGLKYMQSYGWDVDARVGLGVRGEGMLFPLVPKEKRDKLGLGIDKKAEERRKRLVNGRGVAKSGEIRLDAGKMQTLAKVEKRKHEKLQKMFYGNDEVEKYLRELG
ncbi:g-patch domain-containing protein [Stagonosporopsis vannaccii]|nr:g-patch domain-containing protein [Stagonosporopsis vannaccii]